ncbi:MAG TPA: hypothetical protein VGD71_11630 [Kribbella sp.]
MRWRRRGDADFELIDQRDYPLPRLGEPLPARFGQYPHEYTGPDWATPIRYHPRPTTRHTTTSLGGTMTTPITATQFTDPAPAQRLERAAAALTANGFTVEILDDAAAARTRIKDLIPADATVLTAAS